jgi:hypothetical protein
MLTRTQLADILEALEAARERLEGEVDVIDGDYGEPAPNRAMVICGKIDEAITHCEREFDALPAPISTEAIMAQFDAAIEAIKAA